MQTSQRLPGSSTWQGAAFTSNSRPSGISGPKTSKFSPIKSQMTLDPFENQSGGRYSSVLVSEAGLPSPSIKVKSPAFKLIEGGEMPQPGENKWSPERL
jgi:hypothetical protein